MSIKGSIGTGYGVSADISAWTIVPLSTPILDEIGHPVHAWRALDARGTYEVRVHVTLGCGVLVTVSAGVAGGARVGATGGVVALHALQGVRPALLRAVVTSRAREAGRRVLTLIVRVILPPGEKIRSYYHGEVEVKSIVWMA